MKEVGGGRGGQQGDNQEEQMEVVVEQQQDSDGRSAMDEDLQGVGQQGSVDEEESNARSEATFQYTVENISSIKEQTLSPPTYVRNLPWRIMVMPRQDQTQVRNMSLGFFLQCNGDSDSASWNCSAVATLKILSHKPNVEPFSRKISHIFHSKENDWGYSNFIDWNGLHDVTKGYVKNDSITLEVDVKADAPHGVAWDSKKHTGFVGLKNQGATCYMNSLLQTLFFTNQLRKAVYKMPTESDDSTKSVALALQRVIYELQTSDKPVGTKKLTRSFGWETLDSFMQHDVQEFLRVLLDKLESKMKGTCVEGTVPRLFEGKMISFIKCKHVLYESSRSETFYDIQLNIKGKKDIYESFRNYVATELLDGDNKYDAGSHGLQEAEKGVVFTSFPPVLHLHLMRFQYDPITDCSVKNNDRFEFFEKIDLREFVRPEQGQQAPPCRYTLHAVLVHSGDNHGGHYVVFINPAGDGRWCKFDDDVVSRCSKTEAIQHNFGGQEMDDLHPGVKQSTNAYMLVYIRDDLIPEVLQEVTEDDIPRELLERLKEEKNLEQIKRRERLESHLYTQVTVILEDAFVGHQGCDLYEPDKPSPAATANSRVFRVLKKIRPVDLLSVVADCFNISPSRLRLWPFTARTNKALRPGHLDTSLETSKSLEELMLGNNPPMFLEMLPADDPSPRLPHFDKENDVLLFLKMFDPWNDSLHYQGHCTIPISNNFHKVAAECRRRAGWSEDTQLVLFEEVMPGNVEKIVDWSQTLDQGLEELMDGDIIVFHKAFSPSSHAHQSLFDQSASQQQPQRKLKTLQEFYLYMQYKYEITFLDKCGQSEPFSLEMSLKSSYMEMASRVAMRLGAPPTHLQFYKCQPYKDSPAYPIKFDPESDLLSTLAPTQKPVRTPYKLFYQLLGIPITELDRKRQFKLLFYAPPTSTPAAGGAALPPELQIEQSERELVFYVDKAPRIAVSDMLAEISRVLSAERNGGPVRPLRLVEVSSHRIHSIAEEDMSGDLITSNSTTTRYYRAEEILEEETQPDVTLVGVAHFHKEPRATFGVPFLIAVRFGVTTWSELKSRLQSRVGVSDKEWAKTRVALVMQGVPRFVDKDEDENTLKQDHFSPLFSMGDRGTPGSSLQTHSWIGLEHVNKAFKRSRYSTLEKAIKIYN